ncbi:hypothetical protein [Blattabacterium cuenoti]|uniref:hypothetical protein n=1 Tax=Blattabacterium cuenoti TaxID=1653831 RepID=UPI00163CF35F|nr:hypothetical protein [Blattabacterium cuenoti]
MQIRTLIKKLLRLEKIKIPYNFSYKKINSLSLEAREKLSLHKPMSLAEAAKISGVSPSDLNVILIYIRK